jgi:hypothetical protein
MKFVVGTTLSANGGGTTVAIDTTGVDLIIAGMVCSTGTFPAIETNFSDSKGNTWGDPGAASVTDGSGAAAVGIMFCINPVVGSGHTFTMGAAPGNQFQALVIAAYKHANTGLEAYSAGGTANGAINVQPGSVTPSFDNSLVITIATSVADGATFTIDSGFTVREERPLIAGVSFGVMLADLFQGTAAAVNPTLTSSVSAGLGTKSYVFRALPGPDETLIAGQGSYALTGEPALFGRSFGAARGLYTLTGEPAGFGTHPGAITADTGYYTLTGQAANFHLNDDYALVADPGFYTLTGFDATLCKRRSWDAQDCTDSPWTAVRKSNPN